MIVSMTMVQSESDIIEYFVRSNMAYVDYMVMIVNPSEDGTLEILEKLCREGLGLIIWKSQRNMYAQRQIFNQMLKRVRDQLEPDYILILDADEIIIAPNSSIFRQDLDNIPAGNVGAYDWITFIPQIRSRFIGWQKKLFGRKPPLDLFHPGRWNYRLSSEVMAIQKIILPKHAKAGRDIQIANGFHQAFADNGQPIPTTKLANVELAHIPVRSPYQIKLKTLSGIINKGIADGPNWMGLESFQLNNMMKYFQVEGDFPDIQHITINYLSKDWCETAFPALKYDRRLPIIELRYNNLIRKPPIEIALTQRVMSSIFPLADPTLVLENQLRLTTEEQGLPEGIFSSEFHVQNLFCDWPPFDMIQSKFEPKSVLDIGCGLGPYLRLFREKGADVYGVDGPAHSIFHFIAESEYQSIDMEKENIAISNSYDISICVEVLEHLDEDAAASIISLLCKCTVKAILFSAAQPDQPGYAHKNLREPDFWLRQFAAGGWAVDVPGSIAVRFLSTLHWFKRNLFVLVPTGKEDARGLGKLMKMGVHRDQFGGSIWRAHRKGETVIGFPGQAWAMTMDCSEDLAPMVNAVRRGADPNTNST